MIYIGNKKDAPHTLHDFEMAQEYLDASVIAGIRGEILFEKQACEHKFLAYYIDQSKESYARVTDSTGAHVKELIL